MTTESVITRDSLKTYTRQALNNWIVQLTKDVLLLNGARSEIETQEDWSWHVHIELMIGTSTQLQYGRSRAPGVPQPLARAAKMSWVAMTV